MRSLPLPIPVWKTRLDSRFFLVSKNIIGITDEDDIQPFIILLIYGAGRSFLVSCDMNLIKFISDFKDDKLRRRSGKVKNLRKMRNSWGKVRI